jgi:hypothetical protein
VKLFFWLKSLYQLGFVRFFGFYFWIGVVSKDEYYYQTVAFLPSQLPVTKYTILSAIFSITNSGESQIISHNIWSTVTAK